MGIPGNEKADEAARGVVSRNVVEPTALPFRDYYPGIKRKVREVWELEWQAVTDNKLREIKDSVSPWQSSYQRVRQVEVALCRLRIGHTLPTHKYLMERDAPPVCPRCAASLTVKHILTECPATAGLRSVHFGRSTVSLSTVLTDYGNFDARRVISYLRATGISIL